MSNEENANSDPELSPAERFEIESKKLKKVLLDLQANILSYSKANEDLLAGSPTPVNLFTRVNMGNMIVHFSDLAKAIFAHEDSLNKALAPKVDSSES